MLFIFDDSARVGPTNFRKVTSFANSLLGSFSIKNGATHVAAMSYSNTATVYYDFNAMRSMNASGIGSKIMTVPYTGGKSSRLDKALELAAQSVMTPSGGARSDPAVKKVRFFHDLLYYGVSVFICL